MPNMRSRSSSADSAGPSSSAVDADADVDLNELRRGQIEECETRAAQIVSVLNCPPDLARETLVRFGLSLEHALAHLLESDWGPPPELDMGAPPVVPEITTIDQLLQVPTIAYGRNRSRSRGSRSSDDDPDLRSAIAASLADMRRSPSLRARDLQDDNTFMSGGTLLGSSEENVLLVSSIVRGKVFLPFPETLDPFVNKHAHIPQALFTDEDGLPTLNSTQQAEFGSWQRAGEVMGTNATLVVNRISSAAITQNIVSDCSFLSSTAAAAAIEVTQGRSDLVSRAIYPPYINPLGKYVCRFYINGMFRQVVVDDFVPVGKNGEFLCSTSSNRGELWLTILEKGYMKVMGGYDLIQGSDSCADLALLFGWIPERVKISRRTEFDAVSEWDRIRNAQVEGKVMVTLTTGDVKSPVMDPDSGMEVSTTNGLVAGHCYAVLETRFVQGRRLLKVKNPWASQRWTGAFSDCDTENWTEALLNALDYDLYSQTQFDNGIFWMSWEDVIDNFQSINLAWDPQIYSYRECVHGRWYRDSMGGSTEDVFTYADNPQYSLDITTDTETTISLYLVRHIKTEEDTAAAGPYLALHVFEPSTKRVYTPDKAVKKGVYINSCHFPSKLVVPPGTHRYVLIPSLSTKSTGRFSIFVDSHCPVLVQPIEPQPDIFKAEVSGAWTDYNAGGSYNEKSFWKNPMYCLEIGEEGSPSDVVIKLTTASPHFNNVHLVSGGQRVDQLTKRNVVACGDTYRHRISVIEKTLPAGKYTVIPSTFRVGEHGSFTLTVSSPSAAVTLLELQGIQGMKLKTLRGQFSGPDKCGGCANHSTYFCNPVFRLSSADRQRGRVYIRLETVVDQPPRKHPSRVVAHHSLPGDVGGSPKVAIPCHPVSSPLRPVDRLDRGSSESGSTLSAPVTPCSESSGGGDLHRTISKESDGSVPATPTTKGRTGPGARPPTHGRTAALSASEGGASGSGSGGHHRAKSSGASSTLPGINIRIWQVSGDDTASYDINPRKPNMSSGAYSSVACGVSIAPFELDPEPLVSYVVVISTYEPNQCVDYALRIYSDNDIHVDEDCQLSGRTKTQSV